jgi:very-short-patch-repair endonuclease
MEIIHNKKELKENRRTLRNNMTSAEAKLWDHLKKKGLDGKKFRRQHSIGNYILDFYCPGEKLCIELDGEGHYTSAGYEYDLIRTGYLNSLNIKVCRIENKRVFENMEGVLQEIRSYFTTPGPS